MTKEELKQAVSAIKYATRNALELVYNELEADAKNKLLNNSAVKELFDRYGVKYSI